VSENPYFDWADDLAHALYVKATERGDVMSYELEENIASAFRKLRFDVLENAAKYVEGYGRRLAKIGTTPSRQKQLAATVEDYKGAARCIRTMKTDYRAKRK
jgi:hypothetical protein